MDCVCWEWLEEITLKPWTENNSIIQIASGKQKHIPFLCFILDYPNCAIPIPIMCNTSQLGLTYALGNILWIGINYFLEKHLGSSESSFKFIVSKFKNSYQSWNSFIAANPKISFDKLLYPNWVIYSSLKVYFGYIVKVNKVLVIKCFFLHFFIFCIN